LRRARESFGHLEVAGVKGDGGDFDEDFVCLQLWDGGVVLDVY
jgi:hypothetical protein